MNKLLLRYLIYFGIFITLVQLFEYKGTQELFAKCGFRVDFSPLGTYAPLFLSALLIDITYRIGKRQNEIAQRQNEIAEQQTALQKEQYQLDKFNTYKELYRCLFGLKRFSQYILPKIYDYIMSGCSEEDLKGLAEFEKEANKIRDDFERCEADFDLRVGKEIDLKEVLGYIQITQYLILKAQCLRFNGEKPQMPIEEFIKQRSTFRLDYKIEQQAQHIKELTPNAHLANSIDSFVSEYIRLFEGDNSILTQIKKLYNE